MPFISFIKLSGPPIYEAIKALHKIALDFPEVCVMDSSMQIDYEDLQDPNYVQNRLTMVLQPLELKKERCSNLISKSGDQIGNYDYFYEWFKTPTVEQLYSLIQKIDEALTPLGCKYSITSINK
jgi:hypothetical protein